MTIEPRPVLGSLPHTSPGVAGTPPGRAGRRPGVNLATNETQFGPFPAAAEVIRRHAGEAHRYPELDGELTQRIAAAHGVSASQVALGNGADAIIGYLCTAYLEPGTNAVMGAPRFPPISWTRSRPGPRRRRRRAATGRSTPARWPRPSRTDPDRVRL